MPPLQHEPQGVAVHEPPLDQAPPAAVHAGCVVTWQEAPWQHVPHGLVVQVVPAVQVLPLVARQTDWMTVVHVAFGAQHEPCCGQLFGVQTPPGVNAPAQSGLVT